MTLPPLPIRRARKAATAVHDRLRIRDASDIDVEGIAAVLGLDVRRGRLPGADARLVGASDIGIIRLSNKVEHEGAQRFSVAHELGHRQLSHRSDKVPSCEPTSVHGHFDRGVEAEANAFAAELLMPERLLRRRCEVSPVSLDHARSIAADFKVSLLAAALRFIELTSERCALILSRGARVVWVSRSPTFIPFIARDRMLGKDSAAVDWFWNKPINLGMQPVPAHAWLDDDIATDLEVFEDSVALDAILAVLSLVWIPEPNSHHYDR